MLLNTLENILREVDMEKGYQLLTSRERNIISLYYLEGYKDEEIANHYGVTRQNIFKIRKNGIIKLKKKKYFKNFL
jgi:RNA polymerase sigma factor (sigma-70 family)